MTITILYCTTQKLLMTGKNSDLMFQTAAAEVNQHKNDDFVADFIIKCKLFMFDRRLMTLSCKQFEIYTSDTVLSSNSC